MKLQKLMLLLIVLLNANSSFAQQKFTISGYVKCAETGEGLLGSTIYVEELKVGAITNLYGFYSITLPEGNYTLRYSYIGYAESNHQIELVKNIINDLELKTSSNEIEEVQIVSEAADKNIKELEMSVVKLSPKDIKAIPMILGEQDILKTIQLLPG